MNVLEQMNTNTWHTHHDTYLGTEPLQRQCADCYASWTPSSDGLSAHMVHEAGCLYVAFLWDQDQGRDYVEWSYSECPDGKGQEYLEDYDRWHAALLLNTEYLGEWCSEHQRTVLRTETHRTSGFGEGETVEVWDLACGHQITFEG